jgi:TM2 domain-containing membrane protein YozV
MTFRFLLLTIVLFSFLRSNAETEGLLPTKNYMVEVCHSAEEVLDFSGSDTTELPKIKKWLACVLSFPVVGVTGAHRVYLGCDPYVPVVYLATVGVFGILPAIDFFVILFSGKEKLEALRQKKGVFLWVD